MKKDIIIPVVEGIKVAVIKTDEALNQWDVFLINRLETDIDTIFVTSRGYGLDVDGNEIKTAQLRYSIKEIPAGGMAKIEPISPDIFHINNEYWVSYYIGLALYDKRFVFVPESIREENLITIMPTTLKGILHE